MKPIDFPQRNVIFAEKQKEYLPLPAHRTSEGEVISCWQADWRERLVFLFSGRLWLSQLSFNNKLQPLLPMIDTPFLINHKTIGSDD